MDFPQHNSFNPTTCPLSNNSLKQKCEFGKWIFTRCLMFFAKTQPSNFSLTRLQTGVFITQHTETILPESRQRNFFPSVILPLSGSCPQTSEVRTFASSFTCLSSDSRLTLKHKTQLFVANISVSIYES